jgi:hypothetical protein
MSAHRNSVPLGAAFVLWAVAGVATAAPHAGDVQLHGRPGSIGLNDSLFLADFGDLPGGPFRTTNPGFDVDLELGPLGPGNWLRYEMLGALHFWDGAQWTAPLGGVSFRLDDALGSAANPADDTVIDGDGVVAKRRGIVGEIDSGGALHEHLTMGLRLGDGTLGAPVGAYFVSLRVFETLANDDAPLRYSAPFAFVLNRGLTSTAFDLAVDAAPAPVPLPGAIVCASSALLVLAGRRRSASINPPSTSRGAQA